MQERELRSIAERWWRSRHDYDHDAVMDVDRIVTSESPEIPRLIEMLIATAPSGMLNWVGTAILEDIHYSAEGGGRPDPVFTHLRNTSLTVRELYTVLSGVYPNMLEEWGIREALAGTLTTDQIAWLIDREAPGRTIAL